MAEPLDRVAPSQGRHVALTFLALVAIILGVAAAYHNVEECASYADYEQRLRPEDRQGWKRVLLWMFRAELWVAIAPAVLLAVVGAAYALRSRWTWHVVVAFVLAELIHFLVARAQGIPAYMQYQDWPLSREAITTLVVNNVAFFSPGVPLILLLVVLTRRTTRAYLQGHVAGRASGL